MPHPASRDHLDVAVVGAGPAGLAAAMYLARFLRSVIVFDAGDARARLIPRTHNCPSYPEGISGEELLRRLRAQARNFGVSLAGASVDGIALSEGSFVLTTTSGITTASRVVLATGIVDRTPAIDGLRDAVAAGLVRLCPICDAYEAMGQRIGVMGPQRLALKEALYLKTFSPDIALLLNDDEDVSETTRREAAAAGIEIIGGVRSLVRRDAGFDIVVSDGPAPASIDLLYPAMGCNVRSELARMLGAACDEDGYVVVDQHLRTSVPGLYAIGDVAKALNQIAVGFGHAALAATDIHNSLREAQNQRPRWQEQERKSPT